MIVLRRICLDYYEAVPEILAQAIAEETPRQVGYRQTEPTAPRGPP